MNDDEAALGSDNDTVIRTTGITAALDASDFQFG